MLEDVVSTHPVEDELRLVGHPHDVVLHGVGEEAALVDELYEGQPGVLLQRVLPLLGMESASESFYTVLWRPRMYEHLGRNPGINGWKICQRVTINMCTSFCVFSHVPYFLE